MGSGTTQTQVISAARFFIEFENLGKIAFSELSGITSKVTHQEYIYNDEKGQTHHTKQFGKTEPPTITLKRGLDADGNAKLLAWHAMARHGQPGARSSGFLTVMDASGDSSAQIVYQIVNGWCSEIVVNGMKAGDSAVPAIECKIVCEEIVVPSVSSAG